MRSAARVMTLLAATALLAGPALAMSPAQAASGEDIPWTYTTDAAKGGKADFAWNGNKVTVCDNTADGYGVLVGLYDSVGDELVFVADSNSSDGCKSASGTSYINGMSVQLTVCLYQGETSNQHACRTSAYGVA